MNAQALVKRSEAKRSPIPVVSLLHAITEQLRIRLAQL